MNWNWNWESIGSIAAVMIAVGALLVALRSNRLVGVYKRAIWTVNAAPAADGVGAGIRLRNNGESPAMNVLLSLDVDALHLWSSAERIQLIGPGSSEVITFRFPHARMLGQDENMTWSQIVGARGEESRRAVVAWTDLEGRTHKAEIMLPATWDPRVDEG